MLFMTKLNDVIAPHFVSGDEMSKQCCSLGKIFDRLSRNAAIEDQVLFLAKE
jgi:hypothetical protein